MGDDTSMDNMADLEEQPEEHGSNESLTSLLETASGSEIFPKLDHRYEAPDVKCKLLIVLIFVCFICVTKMKGCGCSPGAWKKNYNALMTQLLSYVKS